MMKPGLTARVEKSAIPVLPIFPLLQKAGNIPEHDMYNTFNMGVGMVLALPTNEAEKALELLAKAGETAAVIGKVVAGGFGVEVL